MIKKYRQLSLGMQGRNWSKYLHLKSEPKSFKKDWNEARPFTEIPGPRNYPILGMTLEFLFGKFKNASNSQILDSVFREYGEICKLPGIFGRPGVVLVFNPKDMELVYRMEGPTPWRTASVILSYYRKHFRTEIFDKCRGLFCIQGKEWLDMRQKVNPVILKPGIMKHYITPIEEVADEFVARMVKLRDANNEMPDNFDNELNKWALESIIRVAMDARLGCLEDNISSESDSQKMLEAVILLMDLTRKLDFTPSPWRWIRTPAYKKSMSLLERLTELSLKKINSAAKEFEINQNKSVHQESVLEKLIKIDKNLAVVMALDMLIAGIDTTSGTLATLLYFIAKHQKVQDKLREEIKDIPFKESLLTPEYMNRIPYLKACMKEAARIAPAIVSIPRRIPEDIVLGGYQIPKGTKLQLGHMVASNTESQFPKPKEFIPERWLIRKRTPISSGNSTTECPVAHDGTSVPGAKEAHRFSYMPFGFGPRMCIGKRLADLEIEIFVIKLLRKYRIEWNYGELEYKAGIANVPSGPLKYKITEIK